MIYYYIMSSPTIKAAFQPFNSISRSFTSNMSETTFGIINGILSNDWLRSLLLIIVSVWAGYTLQPVPKKLNNLFDTSTSFKFLILFVLMLTALYPLDNNKVILSIVVPVLTLVFFEFLRKVDDMDNDSDSESGSGYSMSCFFRGLKAMLPSMDSLFTCHGGSKHDASMSEE